MAVMALAVCSTGSNNILAVEPNTKKAQQAYRLTLQILEGFPSCGDEWSEPEYYAAASRRDLEVETELKSVRLERDGLRTRIGAFDKRIEPLLPREHSTVPLTDDEQLELDTLHGLNEEIQQTLRTGTDLPIDERRALESEQSETKRSIARLENRIPLTEEESRFLEDQRRQRAPLVARRELLATREAELSSLISMRTPGSLRVYPDDELSLRLMESDAFADDTCVTWSLSLDEEILNRGGTDLKNGDRSLLRLWFQRVPASFDDDT